MGALLIEVSARPFLFPTRLSRPYVSSVSVQLSKSRNISESARFSSFRPWASTQCWRKLEYGTAVSFGAVIQRYLAEEIPERHSTASRYRCWLKNHVEPKWRDYPIEQIKPLLVEGWPGFYGDTLRSDPPDFWMPHKPRDSIEPGLSGYTPEKLFLAAGKDDFCALRTLGEVYATLTGLPLPEPEQSCRRTASRMLA